MKRKAPEPQDPFSTVTSEAVMGRLSDGFANVKLQIYGETCFLQMTYAGKTTIVASAKPHKSTTLMLKVSILGETYSMGFIEAYELAIKTNELWHSVSKRARVN